MCVCERERGRKGGKGRESLRERGRAREFEREREIDFTFFQDNCFRSSSVPGVKKA